MEIQKELDAHKQECYGHMKVIQELRFGKMQEREVVAFLADQGPLEK